MKIKFSYCSKYKSNFYSKFDKKIGNQLEEGFNNCRKISRKTFPYESNCIKPPSNTYKFKATTDTLVNVPSMFNFL